MLKGTFSDVAANVLREYAEGEERGQPAVSSKRLLLSVCIITEHWGTKLHQLDTLQCAGSFSHEKVQIVFWNHFYNFFMKLIICLQPICICLLGIYRQRGLNIEKFNHFATRCLQIAPEKIRFQINNFVFFFPSRNICNSLEEPTNSSFRVLIWNTPRWEAIWKHNVLIFVLISPAKHT